MSFFDDEDEEPPTTVRPAHTQQQPRPQPRRPQRADAGARGRGGGPESIDHHAMMVRRRIAAGIGVVLLIVIVLLVNGCLKRGKQQALESYNRDVNQIAQASESQVARPLFTTLSGAGAKSALDVEVQVDQLRRQAQELAERAKGLSVPSQMTAAQRDLLLALDMRVEGVSKVAGLVREALGGKTQQASTKIAGAMEIFLASDVVYSQRVVPLIQQALTAGGVSGQSTTASRFLPNLGWLTPATVQSRITGQSTGASGAIAPGTHGHSLKGVSVGTNTLAPSPTLNHVSGGDKPDFHRDGGKRGLQPGDERQGRRVGDDRRQDSQRLAHDRQDRTGEHLQRGHTGQRRHARGGLARNRQHRGGARRDGHRKQQGHLPGDLRQVGAGRGRGA